MGFCCLLLPSLLLLLLTGPPQAESPPFHPNCDDGEYASSGICCLMCPAGSYVDESCIEPHTRGWCRRCTEGEDYTAFPNGLSQCLPCDECKHGKRMVKPCTVKSNTICQCKDGYYCPPVCEECIRCTQKCPEGQVIVQNCNATADLKCGPPPEDAMEPTFKVIISIVVIVIVTALVLCLFLFKKKFSGSKRDEGFKDALISDSKETLSPKVAVSTYEEQNVNSGLGSSPSVVRTESPENAESKCSANDLCEDQNPGTTTSAPLLSLPDDPVVPAGQSNGLKSSAKFPEVIVKNPSHSELNTLYYEIRHTVLPHDWKMLMRRMGLSDNDIHKIIRDHFGHADEQDYQMLRTLQNRFGIAEALCKLLNGLWDMKLMRIYENLVNELKSKDIITVKNNCL